MWDHLAGEREVQRAWIELHPGLGARKERQTKKPLHGDGAGDGGLRGVARGGEERQPLDLVGAGLEQEGRTPARV